MHLESEDGTGKFRNIATDIYLRKRIGFVNNLTMKHCDKTKVKTITAKNSQKTAKKL